MLESELAITPEPSEIAWTRDAFGNHVATARFADRAAVLHVESRIRIDHAPAAVSRGRHRGSCAKPIRSNTRRTSAPSLRATSRSRPQPPEIARWAAGFLAPDGTADTHALLAGMTQTIKRTFRHGARHQKGTQDPALTLRLASGSCRDLAVLMIAALRSLGFAARFVSGYLNVADCGDESLTGGNTHAWVQAYVPGPGWVDLDPSSGDGRQREPRARRGGARAARGDPAARQLDRLRVGPSGHERRRQGRGVRWNFNAASCLTRVLRVRAGPKGHS